MADEILRLALAYAAAGFRVFPCKPGAKTPAIPNPHPPGDPLRDTCSGECGRDGHGFKDATTDPGVIRAWWQANPRRNVAIATGAPGPDVLDVDVKPDGSGWAAFNQLKRAGLLTGAHALVRTPSGGLHVYYRGTGQASARLARHFIDFKAAGGYVLAPPSVVDGRRYELVDHRQADARLDWQACRALLDPPPVPNAPPPGRITGATAQGRLRGLVQTVLATQPGNRNNPLFWAACRAGEMVAAGEVDQAVAERALVKAAIASGLRGGEAEARRTVASGLRRGGA